MRLAMTRSAPRSSIWRRPLDADLTALVELYRTRAITRKHRGLERALALKGQSPEQRALTLSMAVTMLLRQAKGEARNARLEAIVDEMDKLPERRSSRRSSPRTSR